ncbi:MAG TPA: transposase [Nitrospiria bacterium]
MARPLRVEYAGALYHVTSRGNARKPIFKDEEDRKTFLRLLDRVNQRFHWLCHAYCLMDNHYHLVIETPEGNLAKGMRQINGVYTQAFNRRHRRVGHLFQGRYKAILVERESYLLEVCRYVVLNPVRAKAIGKPEAWRWSSYRGTGGLEKPQACLTTDWILGQLGTGRTEAARRYREFVREGMGKPSIWNQVRGQSLLGADGFVEEVGRYLKKHESVREIPRRQRYLHRPRLAEMFNGEVRVDRRKRDEKIIKAVDAYGYSQKEVADYLEMHYSTISRLVNRKIK